MATVQSPRSRWRIAEESLPRAVAETCVGRNESCARSLAHGVGVRCNRPESRHAPPDLWGRDAATSTRASAPGDVLSPHLRATLHVVPTRLLCILSLVPVLVGTACDSIPSPPRETTSDDYDGGGTGSSWSPVCPDSAPTAGKPCGISTSTACEYGDAWWDISCDTVVTCDNYAWVASVPGSGTCTPRPGPNPASCPPSANTLSAACSDIDLTCYYGTVECTCGIAGLPYPPADAGPTFNCAIPGPGCPSVRPRLGATCSTEGLLCNVGAGLFGEQCVGGNWQVATGGP